MQGTAGVLAILPGATIEITDLRAIYDGTAKSLLSTVYPSWFEL